MRRLEETAVLVTLTAFGVGLMACEKGGGGNTGGSGGATTGGAGGSSGAGGGGFGGSGGGTGGSGGGSGGSGGGSGGSGGATGGSGGAAGRDAGATGGTAGGGAGGGTAGRDGGTAGAGGAGGAPATGTYYPLKVGSRWVYRVTAGPGQPTYKVVTVDALETVGGTGPNATKPAYKQTTCKGALMIQACDMPPSSMNPIDRNVGWRNSVNNVVVNYREQAYFVGTTTPADEVWWEPSRIRIDETPARLMPNVMYSETFREVARPVGGGMTTSTMDKVDWQVLGVNETVMITIPGGAPKVYPNCIRLTHTTALGASKKTFWYSRGIGKVREEGGQTEELIDYRIAP